MYNHEACITRIQSLRGQGGIFNLRYAVLEARFSLEMMALDRLKAAKKYISGTDLKRWKPKDVINFLVAEVDGRIEKSFTLSISKEQTSKEITAVEGYERIEYIEVGTQSLLDVHLLNRLWHKASNFLHANIAPRDQRESIESIERFLDSFEVFAQEVAKGNLVMAMIENTVTFPCKCGREIKRSNDHLRAGLIIGCPSMECQESYICKLEGDKFILVNRGTSFNCPGCHDEFWIPRNNIDTLRGDQRLQWTCSCGETGFAKNKLELMYKKK